MEYARFVGFVLTSMAMYIIGKDIIFSWAKDDTVESVKDDKPSSEFVDEPGPKDDLTRLDGIKKDMLPLLKKAQIVSYSDLELADENEVKQAVENEHPEVTVSEIKLWIRQASLAEQERWDELERLKEAMQKARAKRQ